MAAVKYEFSIGALKAFYSIFCADILLVYNISTNALSENKKNRPPKFHQSAHLRATVYIKIKHTVPMFKFLISLWFWI